MTVPSATGAGHSLRDVLLGGRPSIVLISLTVGAFAFNTVEMMPLGMLPQITTGLGLSAQQGGALVSGYAAVIALATVPLVRLAARRLAKMRKFARRVRSSGRVR